MTFTKTALGQTALQNRSLALTPRQRSAFIMFDGKRSTEEVLKATAGLGVTTDDVNHLVTLGLLAGTAAAVPEPGPASAPGLAGESRLSAQEHYSKAYPIATRLTAELGLRGFRLNLAVEAAGDLVKLRELAPKIKEAVGPEKFRALEHALYS
ncbi:hypothetical protein [Polaromonas jejuensis]|uniref:Uncharacterized protein n=1 Tax=Polaromonas jejuensis TaxID=457502 RepID=A0ABW0QAH6_9BURK|nr:hypothetical protein [Polaromonas jejuensis]